MERICPDLDAHLFFDPDEIQAAYLLRNKAPPAPPHLNEVLRQIGKRVMNTVSTQPT